MKPEPWWREPTKGQWLSFSAAWAGWVLDAFDFTLFLLVIPDIAREFGASTTAVAGSVTLTLLVRLIGGVVAGHAADRWGRRMVLMVSVIWFATCDAAVAAAPTFTWVLVLRTLFGFGMGAEWTAGTTLAMENWPERSRGIASGILQGSWAVGYLLAAVVSAVVLPIWGWRALFVIAALPALLVIPIRMWVPESQEWKKGKASRATGTPSIRELFRDGIPKRIAWASLAMTLGFGVYYAMSGLYPTLLSVELGMDPGGVGFMVGAFNVGMLVGAVVCGAIASRRGILAAVVIPALLAVPLMPLYVGVWPSALFLGALLGGALGVGWCGVVPAFLTGMFPAHVRGRAVGITYHVGAFFAAFVITGVAALWEHTGWSLGWCIALVAGGFEVALAAVLLLAGKKAFGDIGGPVVETEGAE